MAVREALVSKATDINRPLFARVYERVAATAEQRGQTEHRRELLCGLEGRVIEVGAGHGLNFAHYPATVSEVVAVEPEPHLRAKAELAARGAAVAVRVAPGVGDDLPFEAATFDAGVASLMLCSVPDQATALAELFRVIRPAGELPFYEHVRASSRPPSPNG
ncbi:MAG: class I SAM-dependent methyltransferase [Acidimicrobiales bacterium]